MSRYINIDDVGLRKTIAVGGLSAKALWKRIRQQPSIDIVRCKECKHRPIKEDADGEDYGFNVIAPNMDERCPCLVEDGWYSWMPKDDFYCGYGEREGE